MMPSFKKIVLMFLLVLKLEESVSQQCEAQVVVTTQEDLKKQISSEIIKTLSNYTFNNSPNATSSPSHQVLSRIEQKLDEVNARIQEVEKQIHSLHEDGSAPCYAAGSCAEILTNNPSYQSGYYWVKNATGHPHSVYCDMTRSCGGVTGGWMRVAYLDMTNSSHQCPSALRQRIDSGVCTCAPYSDSATCSSVHYSSGMHYSKVCGKIRAYHDKTMDGFVGSTIDSIYVDGISVTHGRAPRHHIWTFAVRAAYCPCGSPPTFVSNHYFCEIARRDIVDLSNPLWDGKCDGSPCDCTINSPPWFYRQLPQPTSNDIEVRVCRNQERSNEDVLIQAIDIFIQ